MFLFFFQCDNPNSESIDRFFLASTTWLNTFEGREIGRKERMREGKREIKFMHGQLINELHITWMSARIGHAVVLWMAFMDHWSESVLCYIQRMAPLRCWLHKWHLYGCVKGSLDFLSHSHQSESSSISNQVPLWAECKQRREMGWAFLTLPVSNEWPSSKLLPSSACFPPRSCLAQRIKHLMH